MKKKFQWWKLIVGYLLFIFFHEIYNILDGNIVGRILGEGIESIYAHMKMFFYAYLLVCVIEYFLRRAQIAPADTFWYSRMLIASAFPWMSIAIWYVPAALGFDLGKRELAYSIILTAIGFYFAIRLDEGLESASFRPTLQILIWGAFIAAWITYIGFSFHTPDNFFMVAR